LDRRGDRKNSDGQEISSFHGESLTSHSSTGSTSVAKSFVEPSQLAGAKDNPRSPRRHILIEILSIMAPVRRSLFSGVNHFEFA
jgi:hypothetical protein